MRRADAPRKRNFSGLESARSLKPAKSPYAIESYEASARTDLMTRLAHAKPQNPHSDNFDDWLRDAPRRACH